MLEFLMCGTISCQYQVIKESIYGPKYPPDVAHLCQYFEEQKTELPDYCKWHDQPFIPKQRSEF
mgnify:CR=1 FL=1